MLSRCVLKEPLIKSSLRGAMGWNFSLNAIFLATFADVITSDWFELIKEKLANNSDSGYLEIEVECEETAPSGHLRN
jgi:hypothetical protein